MEPPPSRSGGGEGKGEERATHLSVCDMFHPGSLERCSCGVLEKLGVVASVDDQAHDVAGVSELGPTQKDLVWLEGVDCGFLAPWGDPGEGGREGIGIMHQNSFTYTCEYFR